MSEVVNIEVNIIARDASGAECWAPASELMPAIIRAGRQVFKRLTLAEQKQFVEAFTESFADVLQKMLPGKVAVPFELRIPFKNPDGEVAIMAAERFATRAQYEKRLKELGSTLETQH